MNKLLKYLIIFLIFLTSVIIAGILEILVGNLQPTWISITLVFLAGYFARWILNRGVKRK